MGFFLGCVHGLCSFSCFKLLAEFDGVSYFIYFVFAYVYVCQLVLLCSGFVVHCVAFFLLYHSSFFCLREFDALSCFCQCCCVCLLSRPLIFIYW